MRGVIRCTIGSGQVTRMTPQQSATYVAHVALELRNCRFDRLGIGKQLLAELRQAIAAALADHQRAPDPPLELLKIVDARSTGSDEGPFPRQSCRRDAP